MDVRDIKEFLKDASKYLILAFVMLLTVIYVISLHQVVGPSMSPNYQDGDIQLLNKLIYRVRNPKRFEVAVINSKESKYFIKRVIGLPGETIEYKDNILYINGQVVKEPFSKTGNTANYSLSNLKIDKIPAGYYFVMGDNRENSMDSREIGLIPKNDFVGKVSIRLWPWRK